MARPSTYSPILAAKFCERLLSGRSLRAICREDDDMPAASTVFYWLSQYGAFSEQYARAKEAMAEAMFWEMIDIADNVHGDVYIDDKGQQHINYDVIARSKLRVDTRKWVLARLAPKKYGERISQEITTNPYGDPRNMSDEEKVAKINAIYQAALKRRDAARAAEKTMEYDGSDLV